MRPVVLQSHATMRRVDESPSLCDLPQQVPKGPGAAGQATSPFKPLSLLGQAQEAALHQHLMRKGAVPSRAAAGLVSEAFPDQIILGLAAFQLEGSSGTAQLHFPWRRRGPWGGETPPSLPPSLCGGCVGSVGEGGHYAPPLSSWKKAGCDCAKQRNDPGRLFQLPAF